MRFSVPCRILFGMFLAACISARCAFALELPDPRKALGDPALERMAGVIFSQQFEKQGFSGKAPTILPADAPETIVIKKITTRLAKAIQADHPAMRFQLKVVQDNDVNAFCLPGGFIYVNTGLLEFITANNKGVLDESALAGVLGHEMAHAVLRHSMQHWAQLKAGQSVLEQETFRKVMRAMSREQEAEADRYGALYSLRAGYQFSRLIKLFENMARKTNPNPDAKEDVSNSDHPSPWQRAKQLREYMRQLSQVMGLWDESLNSINTDNFDEARTALEILVVEFPNLATVHNNLGWVNYQIYERSLPEQKRGQQQFSYSYVPSMGVILRGVDPTDKEALENARAAFEQARRLNPEMVEAIEGAGLVALAGQDNVAARELFEAGLKLSPKSSGLQNALAVAL
ncbi:MAG: tetratricopeptide repeat protein, partial [Armatimonadetes bacterium]|nr:tetratricopeptide repeat protein [Armatimonadota bacterium]